MTTGTPIKQSRTKARYAHSTSSNGFLVRSAEDKTMTFPNGVCTTFHKTLYALIKEKSLIPPSFPLSNPVAWLYMTEWCNETPSSISTHAWFWDPSWLTLQSHGGAQRPSHPTHAQTPSSTLNRILRTSETTYTIMSSTCKPQSMIVQHFHIQDFAVSLSRDPTPIYTKALNHKHLFGLLTSNLMKSHVERWHCANIRMA